MSMLTAEYKTALAALTLAQADLKGLQTAIKGLGADAALMGASMLPPPAGTAADIASLAISLGRGDWGGALWDVVGLIPIVGDGAKAIGKGSKVAKKIAAIKKAMAKAEKVVAKKTDELAKLCRKSRVGKNKTTQSAKDSSCVNCEAGHGRIKGENAVLTSPKTQFGKLRLSYEYYKKLGWPKGKIKSHLDGASCKTR